MASNIRNFCVISHVDHGKSTLADRLLELTGTIAQRKMREQFLDQMDLERERGITIKMQPVRMIYRPQFPIPNSQFSSKLKIENSKIENLNSEYILNLIDTPGHVDFTYEVSRALAAAEGAILLVDATQGIQAQTLANLHLAKKENLKILGIINKIDLVKDDHLENLVLELAKLTEQNPEEILLVSAKTGENVSQVLRKIVKEVPPPKIDFEKPFRALIFDSHFDAYKGVVAHVKVLEGELAKQKTVFTLATKTAIQVLEVGVFKPELEAQEKIISGEIGYIATGLKDPERVRVGDTLSAQKDAQSFAGYREPQSVVWASLYPESADDYDLLHDALAKLKLNDAALHFEPERQEALGRGFRCGFLGMLHLDITSERLKREYGLALVVTTPTVVYKIKYQDGRVEEIFSSADWPDPSWIKEIQEPWIKVEILSPTVYLGSLMKAMASYRSLYKDVEYLSQDHVILNFEMPLSEILVDLYDKIKSVSVGYASLNYELLGWRAGDLVKLEILVAGDKVEAFSRIVPRHKTYQVGVELVKTLKDIVPKQNFAVALQAAVGGKVIARETIPALRKDVTGYLYGGDYTRKRKLLEKQKKGKKKLKALGKVELPGEIYLKVFKK